MKEYKALTPIIEKFREYKKTKETKKILAGSIDAADLIIDIYNQHSDKFYFGWKRL